MRAGFAAGALRPGQRVVVVAGHPVAGGPRLPTLRLARVGDGGASDMRDRGPDPEMTRTGKRTRRAPPGPAPFERLTALRRGFFAYVAAARVIVDSSHSAH